METNKKLTIDIMISEFESYIKELEEEIKHDTLLCKGEDVEHYTNNIKEMNMMIDTLEQDIKSFKKVKVSLK